MDFMFSFPKWFTPQFFGVLIVAEGSSSSNDVQGDQIDVFHPGPLSHQLQLFTSARTQAARDCFPDFKSFRVRSATK